MRRRLILLALIGLSAPARAGERPDLAVIDDAIGDKELAEKDLVPKGFVKTVEARGDLDGDGLEDIAMVVHRDPKKRKPEEAADPMAQPVLIFTRQQSGKYTLWGSSDAAYADWDPDLSEEDNTAGLRIQKAVLTIASETGGLTRTSCTAKWRKGPVGLQLIGLTVSESDRRCACGSSTDTNFLTGLEIYDSDQGSDGEQLKKSRVKKTRHKPQVIKWVDFDWDKMCSPE